jgi:RNA polymerase sigma-70 factor (ECF subfamily)
MNTNAKDERVQRFQDAALPHFDAAYSYARFLMRNDADAEDAVQQCYLSALRHFDSFRGAAIKPWLFSILRNVCYSEFKRREKLKNSGEFANNDAAAPMWQTPDPAPEAMLARSQDAHHLLNLLGSLPPPCREVIVLRELEEMSYRDIAETLNAPIGTIMSRLARARAALHTLWGRFEQEAAGAAAALQTQAPFAALKDE